MQPTTLTPTTHVTTPHWERGVQKTIYLLNVSPEGVPIGFQPRVRRLTMPLIVNYARKIRAELVEIRERKFPTFPITYEKLQIHEIAKGGVPVWKFLRWDTVDGVPEPVFEQQMSSPSEWNIYIDMDALVSPEMFDPTVMMKKDQVAHNGRDMANMRWRYDQYFMRDGRHWGSCNWLTVASDWCLDVWRPLDDITVDEALANINITIQEHLSGNCKTEHLIDDYTLSRNIARFGLKATTMVEICEGLGYKDPSGKGFNPFLWHIYTHTEEEKLKRMLNVLSTPHRAMILDPQTKQPVDMGWGLMDDKQANQLREEWSIAR